MKNCHNVCKNIAHDTPCTARPTPEPFRTATATQQVRIRWSGGNETTHPILAIDQVHAINKQTGETPVPAMSTSCMILFMQTMPAAATLIMRQHSAAMRNATGDRE